MTEKSLHKQIRTLLNAKGIVYFESTFGKRTTMQAGMPDFIFAVEGRWTGIPGYWHRPSIAVAWECKVGKGKLSDEQAQMCNNMEKSPNSWRCEVVRSLDDAIKILDELGI